MHEMRSAAEAASVSRLVLEPRLTVQEAAALAQTIRTCRGAPLEIDASEVVEIGTPCLQILLAAVKSWRADHQTLAIAEPSVDFLAGIAHLGLDLDALRSAGAAA